MWQFVGFALDGDEGDPNGSDMRDGRGNRFGTNGIFIFAPTFGIQVLLNSRFSNLHARPKGPRRVRTIWNRLPEPEEKREKKKIKIMMKILK